MTCVHPSCVPHVSVVAVAGHIIATCPIVGLAFSQFGLCGYV